MSQPLRKEDLSGFVPAVVTPFDSSGALMTDAFAQIVNWLIGNGAMAICVAGDNGESWNLDPDERRLLTRIAVDQARGRVPVFTGASAPSAKQSIRYAQAASEGGARGIMLMPQTTVLKATREELTRRYETIAKAVDLPIVVYNSPRRSNIELSLADLDAIMSVAPVIGVKEASRDFFHHTHLIEKFRDRLAVMVGPCHFIFPGLALGAHGFIATGPEFLGPDAGRLTALARQAPGPEHAALHYKVTVIYEMLMGTGTWPSALKAALNLIGQPAGYPREPVLPLAQDKIDSVKRTLDELGLLPR